MKGIAAQVNGCELTAFRQREFSVVIQAECAS
jgi:hypothetical protein